MSDELVVERRTPLPVTAERAWSWLAAPGFAAFERLAPPWHRVEVLERPRELADGARLAFRIVSGPMGVRWVAEHRDVTPARGFVDFQVEGPFDRWVHQHTLDPAPGGTCILGDRIVCRLPLGARIGKRRAARELERLLVYRHRLMAAELAMHAAADALPRLHVAVTGAGGLLGGALVPALRAGGHRVTPIVRRTPREGEIGWDPATGRLDPSDLIGVDAVIHLAAENIGARWTAERKRRILESRRDGTRLVAEAMARCPRPPAVLVAVSAVGYFGDRGEEVLTESSPPGTGFLPEVALAWEGASAPAEAAGIRVARPRLGVVITPRGSLLQRMLPVFRLGLGGKLGSGAQWLSWLAIDDVVELVHRALVDETLRGSFNGTAPTPVRNATLTRALARAVGRPALLTVPASAIRLVFGEMGDQAILASTRAVPAFLTATGHPFRQPTIETALADLLGLPEAA